MKKIIGYQVVDINNNILKDYCSFEVLSKELAEKVANRSKKWTIIPIYKGDIENPTFIK